MRKEKVSWSPTRQKGIMDEEMVREGSDKKYAVYEVYFPRRW